MILEIYLSLWLLGILSYGFGWLAKIDIFSILGSLIFIVCSLSIGSIFPSPLGTIEYKTGVSETIEGNTTTITYEYETFQNGFLSFWLSLISLFSFTIILVRRNSERDL